MLGFRDIAHEIKKRLVVTRISNRPIVLMCNRRGGSTILLEMIASEPGMWIANEPDAVLPEHPNYEFKKGNLPLMEHSQFFSLQGTDLRKFEIYIKNLLSLRYKTLGSIWSHKTIFTAKRVCVKIVNAPWMLDWFLDETDAHVVFMMRHPAAQALSVIRQNWDFGVKAYFNRPEELEKICTHQQIGYGQDILRRGNIWETAILDWVVGTHHGRISTRSNLTKIMFENLVTNPADFVENELIGKMGLTDADRMLRLLKRPSSSSNMSNTENINSIRNGDSNRLLSSWMAKLDDSDKKCAQAILDAFEVTAYTMDDPMPKVG